MNIIDTKGKLLVPDNHPQLKISFPDGDRLFLVDNRRSTAKQMNALYNDDTIEEQDEAVLKLLLGEEHAQQLIDLDLPMDEWGNLLLYCIAACTGESFEEVKAQAERGREGKN